MWKPKFWTYANIVRIQIHGPFCLDISLDPSTHLIGGLIFLCHIESCISSKKLVIDHDKSPFTKWKGLKVLRIIRPANNRNLEAQRLKRREWLHCE
jgi:hypothetical protein